MGEGKSHILILKFNPIFGCSIFRKEGGNANEAALSAQQPFKPVACPFVCCSIKSYVLPFAAFLVTKKKVIISGK